MDCLEHFRIVRKVVLLSGKFLYCLEGLHIVWKVFGLSGTFGTFVEFKEFACFELIADINMTKDKNAIKCAAITKTAVCELCHIRFVFKDIVRHVKSNHKDKETVQSLYRIKTFSFIIVLHGVCL